MFDAGWHMFFVTLQRVRNMDFRYSTGSIAQSTHCSVINWLGRRTTRASRQLKFLAGHAQWSNLNMIDPKCNLMLVELK